MEKYGFVYIWFDCRRRMYYIGCHWGHGGDGYICSSDRMRHAYRRRPHDFKRRIVSVVRTNQKDLYEEEFSWLKMIKDEELGKRYYNLKKMNYNHWTLNEDHRTTREKIRDANKGHVAWNKGLKTSEEHRDKLRKSHIGEKRGPRSEETKRKISENHSHYWKGKTHTVSEETKRKIGDANRRK